MVEFEYAYINPHEIINCYFWGSNHPQIAFSRQELLRTEEELEQQFVQQRQELLAELHAEEFWQELVMPAMLGGWDGEGKMVM